MYMYVNGSIRMCFLYIHVFQMPPGGPPGFMPPMGPGGPRPDMNAPPLMPPVMPPGGKI